MSRNRRLKLPCFRPRDIWPYPGTQDKQGSNKLRADVFSDHADMPQNRKGSCVDWYVRFLIPALVTLPFATRPQTATAEPSPLWQVIRSAEVPSLAQTPASASAVVDPALFRRSFALPIASEGPVGVLHLSGKTCALHPLVPAGV
ncbi:hypothetical protein An14g03260 [Aspergillus niger]|uniref:Uncharacterized protein n=2 Tax=Aspergillus niger TaxID=5061 RepID=A2R371_ASPNC|nr:hypothetical protein An14g03260 [Aspergillus niger]CAK46563.1 hypothetical protein An14g03260 [Aspergillus niger]